MTLVDLRPLNVKGKAAADVLKCAGITCNKNGVPGDPEKPTVTSGIRLGTAAGCSRGFGPAAFREIGGMIGDVLDMLQHKPDGDAAMETEVRGRVLALCRRFPIYGEAGHA